MSEDKRVCSVLANPAFFWLGDERLKTLFALLNRDGEEVRVVGGAVRNSILGIPVADMDCATTAKPDQVVQWAEAGGIRSFPTGIEHGTVTLMIGGQPFEVTSLRCDIQTDGRHAEVAFGRDWGVDANRRDFTMNALYVDQSGRLHDPTGLGLADAKARYIRFIGDACRRIEEDHLRILRFFRFLAQYGQGFEEGDYAACIKAQNCLSDLSVERVSVEMGKLVQGEFAEKALRAMLGGGMLVKVINGVPHIARLSWLKALCRSVGYRPSLSLCLCSLCVEGEEEARRLVRFWRLSNKMRHDMVFLSSHQFDLVDSSSFTVQKLVYLHGKDAVRDLLFFAAANRYIEPEVQDLRSCLDLIRDFVVPVFPIDGRDLMERGLKPGPAIGACLKALKQDWIASGFVLEKEALLASLKGQEN